MASNSNNTFVSTVIPGQSNLAQGRTVATNEITLAITLAKKKKRRRANKKGQQPATAPGPPVPSEPAGTASPHTIYVGGHNNPTHDSGTTQNKDIKFPSGGIMLGAASHTKNKKKPSKVQGPPLLLGSSSGAKVQHSLPNHKISIKSPNPAYSSGLATVHGVQTSATTTHGHLASTGPSGSRHRDDQVPGISSGGRGGKGTSRRRGGHDGGSGGNGGSGRSGGGSGGRGIRRGGPAKRARTGERGNGGRGQRHEAEYSSDDSEGLRMLLHEIDTQWGCMPHGGALDVMNSD